MVIIFASTLYTRVLDFLMPWFDMPLRTPPQAPQYQHHREEKLVDDEEGLTSTAFPDSLQTPKEPERHADKSKASVQKASETEDQGCRYEKMPELIHLNQDHF